MAAALSTPLGQACILVGLWFPLSLPAFLLVGVLVVHGPFASGLVWSPFVAWHMEDASRTSAGIGAVSSLHGAEDTALTDAKRTSVSVVAGPFGPFAQDVAWTELARISAKAQEGNSIRGWGDTFRAQFIGVDAHLFLQLRVKDFQNGTYSVRLVSPGTLPAGRYQLHIGLLYRLRRDIWPKILWPIADEDGNTTVLDAMGVFKISHGYGLDKLYEAVDAPISGPTEVHLLPPVGTKEKTAWKHFLAGLRPCGQAPRPCCGRWVDLQAEDGAACRWNPGLCKHVDLTLA